MCAILDLIKDQQTYCADVDQLVMDVARSMVDHNIGAVPVLRDGKLAGIFSERDLMRRVVVEGRDPEGTRVGDVMTEAPQVVSPAEDLENCLVLMRNFGFRHLPVCEEGQVRGMVSLRDILLRDLSDKDEEVRVMRAYIHSAPGI